MPEGTGLRFSEYTVSKKATGKTLGLKIALILFYVFFGLGYCIFFLVPVKMPAVIAVLPLLEAILIFFTWPLVSYDLSACLDSGLFTVTRITKRKKKELFRAHIQEVEGGSFLGKADLSGKTVEDFRGDPKSKNSWVLFFGEKAVVFETTEKLIKDIRFYSPSVDQDTSMLTR